MTKAKRIRQLATSDITYSIREISNIVTREIGECCVEYVSAVLQRAKSGGQRPCDKRAKIGWKPKSQRQTDRAKAREHSPSA